VGVLVVRQQMTYAQAMRIIDTARARYPDGNEDYDRRILRALVEATPEPV